MQRSKASAALRRIAHSETAPMEDIPGAVSSGTDEQFRPRSVAGTRVGETNLLDQPFLGNRVVGFAPGAGVNAGRANSVASTDVSAYGEQRTASIMLGTGAGLPRTRSKTPAAIAGSQPVGALEPMASEDGSLLSRKSEKGARTCCFTCRSDMAAYWHLLTGSWINVLLIFIPMGIVSGVMHWGAIPTFTINFLAIIPLALVLGEVTEDLALRFGDIAGGLINATFGNVVEMMLSISALYKGLYDVVALSLLGSVLSNLLLVLGCCFLLGGCRYKLQNFNQLSNRACNSLLFLSVVMLAFPSISQIVGLEGSNMIDMTHVTAIAMGTMYLLYLLFQLYTHSSLFDEGDDGSDSEDEPAMSVAAAIGMLTIVSVFVAIACEFLTGSIEEMSADSGISKLFLSVIVLPIAGNACEHVTAVIVAMKNKMDLALGVAIGSSIQIAIFVIPFIVLVGWATGDVGSGADFTFEVKNFDAFGVLSLFLAVVHANFVTNDGTSHWLGGAQLVATYILISIAFLYRPDTTTGGNTLLRILNALRDEPATE